MNSLKQYIALLFVSGFLFPQIANAVHHLVVSHNFSIETKSTPQISGQNYEYHSCDYHLGGFKFPISDFNYTADLIIPAPRKEKISSGFMPFQGKVAFHNPLRGPPV